MSRNQRIKIWKSIVDGIIADYNRLEDACGAAISAGTMCVDGPLWNAIWKAFDGMLRLMDEDGWIDWFINKNRCGKKQLKAKGDGRKMALKIKTTFDLARLIVQSEDCRKSDQK